MNEELDTSYLELTADIVAAFVSKNPVRSSELPDVIAAVHAALTNIGTPKEEVPPAPALTPAVPVRKSITDDYLICLDDGKKFKSLRRHLQTAFGMTPDEYRSKWGLPRDYPMVAPGYAAKRSELAKATGLGSTKRALPAEADEPSPSVAVVPLPKRSAGSTKDEPGEVTDSPPAARRRGRPKKTAAAE